MMRYIIVDDEHIAHEIIKGYCDLLPNLHFVQNCYDALEALDCLSNNEVDLIFLDLNMPVLKGFDFLRTLPKSPKVIVTTAYTEFALEGYEYPISDYLLKPFGFERFLKAVNKALNLPVVHPKEVASERIHKSAKLFVQSNKKHIQLDVDDILFIEATGNYVKIVLTTETITIREKFSVFLEKLPKTGFLQVHKSFAVAPSHIKRIEGNQIVIANSRIPIGKIYKLNIANLLN